MRKEIRPAEDCWQWPHDITCFKDLVISSFPPLTPSQMDTSKLGSFVLTTIPQFTTDAIYHTWTFCFLFCLFFFILNISFCIGVEPINNVVIVSSEQWRDSAIHIQYTDALRFLQPYSKLNSRLILQSLIFILLCFILVDAIIFLPVWAVFWIIWEDTMHLWRSLEVEWGGRRG